MVTEAERQAVIDEEHLKLLPIFYWVLAVRDLFLSLFGLIYVFEGLVFLVLPLNTPAEAPDAFPVAVFGWMFLVLGCGFTLFFLAVAALKTLAGFWMRARKHRTGVLVVAGISCAFIPFGTLAGVLTFIVLLRPSVAQLFGPPKQPTEAVEEPAAVPLAG